MGAILQMPPEVRMARFSRELDRSVIEALRAVKRQGGEQASNRTTRDLVISVSTILAFERGQDAVADLFDAIERVLADDQSVIRALSFATTPAAWRYSPQFVRIRAQKSG
jgi:hypothetical protein